MNNIDHGKQIDKKALLYHAFKQCIQKGSKCFYIQ